MLANNALDPTRPSLAEALAVFAGYTLIESSIGSSFTPYWNYRSLTLNPGVYQQFNASANNLQYASGYSQAWQCLFYIVLVVVFATNISCLAMFFMRRGRITDYTELPNLFAIAMNSPPSKGLAGSCGAGPEGEQLKIHWHVKHQAEDNHFYLEEGATRHHLTMTDQAPARRGTYRRLRGE
jgi:hypothetical protein